MNNIIRIAGIFSAAAGMLVLAGCGKQAEAPAAAPPPMVVVAEVKAEDVPITVPVSGTVQGSRQVTIMPQVSGTIEKRLFDEGSTVKEGDPLYLIDPRPFQAQLDAAQAQLAVDQANLEFAQAEVKRYSSLAKQGAGSVEKKQDVLKDEKQAIAAIAKDRANIEQARLNLAYTNISAPFDGIVQATQVYKGAVVSAQQTALTELVTLDPVYVIFNVSRKDVFMMQQLRDQGIGAKTLEQITAHYKRPDGSRAPIEGHLDFRSTQLDPSTDTITGRAIFDNPGAADNQGLIPGQYVALILTVGQCPNTLLIPQTALMQSQEGSAVYVVGKDNKVERRPVKVGRAYQSYWIVKSGLKAGERVITAGTEKISKSGVGVRVGKAKPVGGAKPQ